MELNGQFHASVASPPEERALRLHWIGGCVGPRADVDAVAKRESPITAPAGKRNPVVKPAA
jgi:hypothetical protein